MNRPISRRYAALCGLAAAVMLSACGEGQKPPAPPPPVVTVANPVTRTVTDFDEYVGRFTAVNSVEIRARVSGYLEKVHFTDGQMIKEGDLLFSVDPRPFQNTLDQARANLAQTRAQLAYAEGDLQRGQQLVRDKTITEQTFEQRLQAKRTAEAAVAANDALVRQAELDLQFTELRAPVAGRIGDRRVSPGNLVTGGSSGSTTLLATIVSYDPIWFEFTFDESSFLRYERNAKRGTDSASRSTGVTVGLRLIDERDFAHRGRMDFVDNVIDRATGTIRGRAVFRNLDGLFTPGMFGRVQVPASAPYEALLVSDSVIGTEQVRKFVYIVGTDDMVSQKYVTLGQLSDDLRVIKDGLLATDRVVVNGLMRVRPGIKVNPQMHGAAPAASSPPSGAAPK
ncbi:MAG: efflux RND transporter periplasmic adaptor subunit [Pseudorhodoplanes sp.]|nr:MAG: efflux RND transporter periplasmic adaptor subunit [Pseudorhodoplanes sp.]